MTAVLTGPRLTTRRLTLRLPTLADFDAFAAFLASERAAFVGGPEPDRGKAWRAFAHIVGMWPLRGYGSFVVDLRGGGGPLGSMGLWYPEGWPEVELGWTLWSPEAEGHGYVQEALPAIRRWAYETHGFARCVSYIDAANTRSLRAAARLGAAPDSDAASPAQLADHDIRVFRHPAPADEAVQ